MLVINLIEYLKRRPQDSLVELHSKWSSKPLMLVAEVDNKTVVFMGPDEEEVADMTTVYMLTGKSRFGADSIFKIAGFTVSELIETLSKCNKFARVKMHKADGENLHFVVGYYSEPDKIYLETMSDNDVPSFE